MKEQKSDAAKIAEFISYLCVECRRCGRRAVFEAGSPPTRGDPAETRRRLVCRRCGARNAKVCRQPSLRDARRWHQDRG